MSEFSGRCDLFDHISMEKMYPSSNNQNVLISDEMECFKIFKEKTKGVIYQYKTVSLSKKNIKFFLENDKNLYFDGEKYHYFSREFKTLKSLNNYGYRFKKEIYFETLLDLIPYYPYVIAMGAFCEGNEYVVISEKSEIEMREESNLEYGIISDSLNYFRKELQNHYIEVVNKYFSKGDLNEMPDK